MATYNGERYVANQIESIQAQTFTNWRLLVSDDCSTDRTLDVVQSYSAEDPRIQVISKATRYGGAKENFFSLLTHSNAPYFMFCDQDDVWLPHKIADEVDELSTLGDDEPGAVYTDMHVVDEELNIIALSFLDQEHKRDIEGTLSKMLSISSVAGCTMMGNAALRDIVSGTDCSAALMHDWWLAIVAASCGRMLYLDEPTVLYRQHGDNEVGVERYSFWDKIRSYSESRDKYWLSCQQAQAILLNYGYAMSENARPVVAAYASQLDGKLMRSTALLIKYGLLKTGFGRRMGQLLTLLLGVPQGTSVNASTSVNSGDQ